MRQLAFRFFAYTKNCNIEAVDRNALAVDILVVNVLVISEWKLSNIKTYFLRCWKKLDKLEINNKRFCL